MANFLHRWLNPHCAHCREERHEQKECHNCDVLTQLLERERVTNAKLIEQLTAPKVVEKVVERRPTPTPIQTMRPSWAVRRELLEAEDRARAEILRKREIPSVSPNTTTEDIEQELGIGEAKHG